MKNYTVGKGLRMKSEIQTLVIESVTPQAKVPF